ncbi:MAG: response regulator [Gammaproteobacteria bacterium]|nr:response regulator [Gammaproteobacteria bacterium]
MDHSVLIVEDVAETRLFIEHILNELGFSHIDSAENGVQAAEKLNQHEYKLVMLDLELPDIDGKHLLDEYKLKYPDMLVIICSSHKTVENVKSTWDMGANGFLTKPVDLSKMQNLLSRVGLIK